MNQAQKAVQQQARHYEKRFSREEREHREAVAKFQFFWRSDEPVLQAEAAKWATRHPDDLPEASPNELSGELSAAVAIKQMPLAVGDCVLWHTCPNHCSSLNPFWSVAIDRDRDAALLDYYQNPVPLSQLRRSVQQ